MKEYKRLTKRDNEFGIIALCPSCSRKAICDKHEECVDCITEEQERLAELEDKIENGTLIELPCKVGDKVYIPYKFRNKNGVFETTIEEIRIEEKHIFFWAKPLYTNNSVRVKYLGWKKLKDFNKTWFLTKAESEKKHEELKNENTRKQ